MTVEIRSITEAETEAFLFVTRTVFSFRGGSLRPIQPENTICAFEDGALVSTFNAWPFTWKLNGADLDAAGISSVGTLPHRRRHGHLRRVMTESFRRQRDAGQSMAVLWGSHAGLYQRFGYAVVSHDVWYEISPREIVFAGLPGWAGPDAAGDIRLTDQPDVGELDAIYRAYIADRNGELQRDPSMWAAGPLRPHPLEDPVFAAIYGQEGEAQGYALYTVRDGVYDELISKDRHPDETQRLTLRELVALTPAAYVALWKLIAGHDLVRRIRYRGAPEDDPIFDLLQEPRALRRSTRDGLMARVVDVAAALPQRPYAAPLACTLRVIDPDCDWNDGNWRFETDGDRTTVQTTDAAPDLTLPVHSLASLITGYRSATELVRIGRAESSGADLTAIDRAFATAYRPHCFQHF